MTELFFSLPSAIFQTASDRYRNAQESCRNGRGILPRAFVLAIEQIFQLFLKASGSAGADLISNALPFGSLWYGGQLLPI